MLALITGASSGIGLMYARQLASERHDLIIVSNQQKEILSTAEDLKNQYGIQCHPLYLDLTEQGTCNYLHSWCRDNNHEVDILINNAGVFFFNEILNTSQSRVELMLNLHVNALTTLCKLFSEDMKQRGKGYILNMSSMSAWVVFPGISTYSATKAYILSFSKALWYELRPFGVDVTAVCPGAVDTGLYGLSPYWRNVAVKIGVSMPPEKLVKKALRKMFKGKKQYLPGAINHIFIPFLKHLPDFLVFFALKRIRQFMK